MSGKPFLRFQGVSKWYGQVIALNDVTVDVPPGVTGLLGPNGAGKSTFLKLATGLMRPRQGSVELLGENPWNHPELMSRIGLAPEHDAFYEWMTGHDFVYRLLRLSGYARGDSEAMAKQAIQTVAMEDAADRRIATYSKGMRQRIKIAQALAHRPEALFLDEPLTGTDPVGRRDLVELIRSIGRSGVHVLVSSHVLHEIEAMTKNIVLIAKGRILAEGDLHQIRGLIDEHPHRIRFEADHPRKLAAAVIELEHVVDVAFQGPGEVTVQTRDPDAFYSGIPAILRQNQIRIKSLTSPDDNLQAVFQYLVG